MKYDVVVVGAGPAGSTAAKFLSEKGVKVLLIDKSKFPRDKPCGGALPIRILKRFKYIREKDLIESYSYGCCVYSPSLKYKVELQKNEPVIAMVLRKKFDYELVKLAIESGTTFIDGKTVENIKILDDKANIILDDGTDVESQIVIGADGVWSTIAKKSGLSPNRKNISISLFQEYPMSGDTLDYYFTEKRLCHMHYNVLGIVGYGWIFPKKKHVNIGIGIVETRKPTDRSKGMISLKEIYKDYIQTLKESKIIPGSLKVGKIKGAALPNRPLEKTYADRVILCGDAAGLIHPFSGEGIDYAMSSGEIAADVITEALEVGDTSGKFLSKYETIWKNDFGKTIKLFLRTSKQSGEKTEKIIKLVSKDKKIAEMILEIGIGNLNIYECKWKIVRRLLYVYIKDIISKGK